MKKNVNVCEFNQIFDGLIKEIPTNIKHFVDIILLQNIVPFNGKFGYALKEKGLITLVEAKEYVACVKENLLASKVGFFLCP